MKAAVLPNLDKRGAYDVVLKLGEILKNEEIEAYLPEGMIFAGFKQLPEDELYGIADIIITIGGDGTIIRYAKRAALDNKPVLGINAGRMGYLANIEQNELGLLRKLKQNEYFVEKRMMLSVTVFENGRRLGEYNALNDAVITGGFISRIIDISVGVGGDNINYRADGLILSTPTGSTAYSFSAGGPILDACAEVMVLTPVCAHNLQVAPLVFAAGRQLEIIADAENRDASFACADSSDQCDLLPGESLQITGGRQRLQLITFDDAEQFHAIENKLMRR